MIYTEQPPKRTEQKEIPRCFLCQGTHPVQECAELAHFGLRKPAEQEVIIKKLAKQLPALEDTAAQPLLYALAGGDTKGRGLSLLNAQIRDMYEPRITPLDAAGKEHPIVLEKDPLRYDKDTNRFVLTYKEIVDGQVGRITKITPIAGPMFQRKQSSAVQEFKRAG